MKYLKTHESIYPSEPGYADNLNKIMAQRRKDKKEYAEKRRKEIFDKINSVKVGDIVEEHIVYVYIEEIHSNEEDFYDGNISERIEEYTNYKLQIVKLNDIILDEWTLDEDEALEFGNKFKETDYIPPIVLDDSNPHIIIDGNHRANGLKMVGEKSVEAFVGIKN